MLIPPNVADCAAHSVGITLISLHTYVKYNQSRIASLMVLGIDVGE
jgi:hypothetical protein